MSIPIFHTALSASDATRSIQCAFVVSIVGFSVFPLVVFGRPNDGPPALPDPIRPLPTVDEGCVLVCPVRLAFVELLLSLSIFVADG